MTLTALQLKLETTKGVSIHECAQEAVHVANTLKITVEFQFNDLKMFASPDESVSVIVARYLRENEARRTDA